MLVLINLESATDRRAAMSRQLESAGMPFQRIGIDLRCVPSIDIDAQVGRIHPRLRFDRKRLSSAEIGCWLSHVAAWLKVVDSPGATGLTVIEDDLRLADSFAQALKSLDRMEGFDLVYLGTSSRNISRRHRSECGGVMIHRPIGVIFNTWGYRISRSYVERFVDHPPAKIALPIDHFLGGRGGPWQPRIGVLQPAIVEEDHELSASSQIGPHTRRIDRSPLLQDLRRRILASPLSNAYYSLYRYL